MCKQVGTKENTLVEIMARLEGKKHSRILAASRVIYSRQEIDSARTVLERLLPNTAGNSTVVHHRKVSL